MYNLLIHARNGYWDEQDSAAYEYNRYLSYTHEAIKQRLLPLTELAIAEIVNMPALFAYEFNRDAPRPDEEPPAARVGKLLGIVRLQREVSFKYEFDPDIPPIPTARLRELACELDIDLPGLESYRTHWAVKDVDLLTMLRKEGLVGSGAMNTRVAEELKALATNVPKPTATKPKIFLVHGRNDALKNEVSRWLGKIGFDDIILHEQPNIGRTLITKFEEVAKDVAYAVVLMTPDDVGGLPGEAQYDRARQNVIFELGYFIGVKSLPIATPFRVQ
jgi:hypothetical protein